MTLMGPIFVVNFTNLRQGAQLLRAFSCSWIHLHAEHRTLCLDWAAQVADSPGVSRALLQPRGAPRHVSALRC